MSYPQPQNVYDAEFQSALNQIKESIGRLHERKGNILHAISTIRHLQRGDNTHADLIRFRAMGNYDYMLYDPKSKDSKGQVPHPDLKGWLDNAPEIEDKFDVIDSALSYAPDVMISYVEGLNKASESRKPAQIIAPSDANQPVTIEEKEDGQQGSGILGWFGRRVGTFTNRYTEQKFQYPFADVLEKWERFKGYYKFYQERATRLHPATAADALIIQDEMLASVKLAIEAITDKGLGMDLKANMKVLSDVSAGIVQARVAAMQAQVIGGGGSFGAPIAQRQQQ